MINNLRAACDCVCHSFIGTASVQVVNRHKNGKRRNRRCAHGCMLPPAVAHFDFPNGSVKVKSRAGLPLIRRSTQSKRLIAACRRATSRLAQHSVELYALHGHLSTVAPRDGRVGHAKLDMPRQIYPSTRPGHRFSEMRTY